MKNPRQGYLTRRQQAQHYNELIDEALLAPSSQHQQQLLHLMSSTTVKQLAERVRKRATLLDKRRGNDTKRILATRDELIQMLYAVEAPKGWACAWCDGSSIKHDSRHHAGIGGIVFDSHGALISRISRAIGDYCAFDAELAALAAVISTALEHQQRQLWVYTDNCALTQLWHEHRNDDRLAEIRRLSEDLEKFALRTIPRQHNQVANALAREASAQETPVLDEILSI